MPTRDLVHRKAKASFAVSTDRTVETPGPGRQVPAEYIKLVTAFGAVKVMGPPPSEELLAILSYLFTRDEAQIANRLSFLRPRLPEVVARKVGIGIEQARALLDEMCEKRIIFKAGEGYMLYPLIPGAFENILRTGEDDDWHRGFAGLLKELYDTGYLREYFTRPVKAIRSIPVNKALTVENVIAGPDLMAEFIDAHQQYAVFHACPCRQAMALTGHSCTRAAPTDGCLTFGEFSIGVVESGNGRAVDKSEMRDIVAERREKKLVFLTSNTVPTLPSGVCTCCDCCCHGLGIVNRFGGRLVTPPRHLAVVDEARCNHCGRCEGTCNTHAQVMIEKQHVLQTEKCIGCGNCVDVCKTNAIAMAENRKFRPPSTSYKKLILKILPPVLWIGFGIKLGRLFSSTPRWTPEQRPALENKAPRALGAKKPDRD